MKLFDTLKLVTQELKNHNTTWAICGGIAASIYRETPRFTGDIDIALVDGNNSSALDIAESICKNLGHTPIRGFISDQEGKLSSGPALIASRDDVTSTYHGVDFLLPSVPWITNAVALAQKNVIDYGFAALPTLTPEDLIISKIYAYSDAPDRPYDLDDILSIQAALPKIDYKYISEKCRELKLRPPIRFIIPQ